MNKFLKTARMHDTVTENDALAHSTTGSVLADQFSKAGSFRGRDVKQVFADQSVLDNTVSTLVALRFIFYLRTITRKPKGWFDSETLMKGQGNKDESFKRYLWYLNNAPDVFYKNLWLFVVCGSYKDLWELIGLAKTEGIDFNVEKAFEVYAKALTEEEVDDLALKYLPQIVSNKKATTARAKTRNKLAKQFANYLMLDAKDYRKMKSGGKAHVWQQMISKGLYDDIAFNKISGKALNLLVNGKFLKKHNLEGKYTEWIKAQPVAKFTGYVYELYDQVQHNAPLYKKLTLDKQFDGLIKMAQEDGGGISGNVWCALDTSGSMDQAVANTKAVSICVALGIYFSTLNKGAFHKNVIMFDSKSRIQQLTGSFTDMASQVPANAMGSTNFQSVVDEIVRVRTSKKNVPLEDFPQTLIVISDMQFNPAESYSSRVVVSQKVIETNHEAQMRKLREVFPSEWVDKFRVIWWDCAGRVPGNQPSTVEDGGTYVFSGFDGSIINILLGEKAQKVKGEAKAQPTMEEVIMDALSQDVLLQVKE